MGEWGIFKEAFVTFTRLKPSSFLSPEAYLSRVPDILHGFLYPKIPAAGGVASDRYSSSRRAENAEADAEHSAIEGDGQTKEVRERYARARTEFLNAAECFAFDHPFKGILFARSAIAGAAVKFGGFAQVWRDFFRAVDALETAGVPEAKAAMMMFAGIYAFENGFTERAKEYLNQAYLSFARAMNSFDHDSHESFLCATGMLEAHGLLAACYARGMETAYRPVEGRRYFRSLCAPLSKAEEEQTVPAIFVHLFAAEHTRALAADLKRAGNITEARHIYDNSISFLRKALEVARDAHERKRVTALIRNTARARARLPRRSSRPSDLPRGSGRDQGMPRIHLAKRYDAQVEILQQEADATEEHGVMAMIPESVPAAYGAARVL